MAVLGDILQVTHQASGNGNSTLPTPVSFSATPTDGDLLIFQIGTAQADTLSNTTSLGTQIEAPYVGQWPRCEYYAKIASSEGNSYNFTRSTTGAYDFWCLGIRIQGVFTTLDDVTSDSNEYTTPSSKIIPVSAMSSVGDGRAIAIIASSASTTIDLNENSFVEDYDQTLAAVQLGVASKAITHPDTDIQCVCTFGTGRSASAAMIAIDFPAGGSPSVSYDYRLVIS